MYLGVLGPTSRPRGLRKYIEAELVKQIDSYGGLVIGKVTILFSTIQIF